MGFCCGIVGLPNVGKSTLFNAMVASNVPNENYPFCTVEPNHGLVPLKDQRLDKVARCFSPEKVTPTYLEFVDIAGLVKGASKGEGLGNQFLSQIQEVDAIAHVVRCFEDEKVVHVYGNVDPLRDVAVVDTELIFRDYDLVSRRVEKQVRMAKSGDKQLQEELEILRWLEGRLSKGLPASSLTLDEKKSNLVASLKLITKKPVFYVASIQDHQIGITSDPILGPMRQWAEQQSIPLVEMSMKTEWELRDLEEEERQAFFEELKIEQSGIDRIVQVGYALLGLITFFTTVGTEVRAWTVSQGTTAVQAAGKIHSDFARGFIRAEVVSSQNLIQHGSEASVREKGLIRLEGKDYQVQDGDVIRFRFNV